jgi:hypothetical protein
MGRLRQRLKAELGQEGFYALNYRPRKLSMSGGCGVHFNQKTALPGS